MSNLIRVANAGKAIYLGPIVQWEPIVAEITANYDEILIFRGAGSINGIDPDSFERALDHLISLIEDYQNQGKTFVLIYDGDPDGENQDIGTFFGRLRDHFSNLDPSDMLFISVQSKGWYDGTGNPIANRNGYEYLTFVFEEHDHAHYTQNPALLLSGKATTVWVGPLGDIGVDQFNQCHETFMEAGEQGNTLIYVASINPLIELALQGKLLQARAEENEKAIEKTTAKLHQRRDYPMGKLDLSDAKRDFPAMKLTIVDTQK